MQTELLLSVFFIVIKSGVFLYVIWLQLKNLKGAKKSLGTIREILKLPKYDPQRVSVSDILINQFDREIEFHLDEIRSFSNAALVTGIGGTMALFLFEALSIGTYFIADPGEIGQSLPWFGIFFGLLLALISSLTGVIVHLWSVSKRLSPAHEEVNKREVGFTEAQATALESIDQTELSKQLEELTKAWSEAETVDLIEMVPQFLEGQTKVMSEMQNRFEKEQSMTLEAAQRQRELTQKIDGLLTELNDGQRMWWETITKSQETQFETIFDSLKKLIDERESLTKEIEHLPENIRNSLDVETINQIFGKEAQNYVHQMGIEFRKIIEDLKDEISRYQRDSIAKLVSENREMKEFFENLQDRVEADTVNPLRKIAEQLDGTTSVIPKFGEDLLKSAGALEGVPEKLEETGNSINSVLGAAATEALKPVSEEMRRYVSTVNETHDRLEKIIQGLVKLIREMIQDIEASRV